MRTYIFLILLSMPFLLQAQNLLDTKLDVQIDQLTIEDALLHLSEKANCSISFNSNYFSQDQKVTLHYTSTSLKSILQKCLANSGYTFKVIDNNISLIALPPPIYTISGFVEDSLSGERLIAATVIDIVSGKGTTTNEYGFYSLSIPKGKAQLNYSYLGFKSKDYDIVIGKDLYLSIGLNASITLGAVIVTDSKILPQSSTGPPIAPNFKSKEINKIPTIGGEVDILRYFQTLAGVQSGVEGLGGIHVRGGNADQNLILLDGVPVYNPTHSLGLFSIFNTHTIKSAHLYKGALPAQYGGRLSSVVDIRTREGDTKKFHGGLDVSLFATSLFVEGPILKDKTSFLISARRTHIDPLVQALIRSDSKSDGGYFFYDTNVKLNHQFSDKDRIYLSFYKGGDAIRYESAQFNEDEKISQPAIIESDFLNYNWGNTIFSLRWNHLWNNQFFSNTTFTYSEFKFTNDYGTEEYLPFLEPIKEDESELPDLEEEDFLFSKISLFRFSSRIKDSGLKIDFNYLPTNQHHFKFGGGILVRQFKPSLVSDEFEEEGFDFDEKEFEELESTIIDPTFFATELNIYGEDEIKINQQLKAKIGIHSVLFVAPNKVYPSLQPRLSLNYRVNDQLQVTSSLGKMTQFLHVLQSTSTGIPNDLWVPSTKQVRPQSAWQADIGVHYQLPKHFKWSLEGYYKYMNHLITYREDTDFLLEEELQFDWENEVAVGKGRSYGLETSLTKTKGKTTGWINYNLAWSDRQYEAINQGQRFPFRYNRRHELKIGLSQQFTRVFNLFATWKYGSGQWTTILNIDPELEDESTAFLQPFPLDPDAPINNYQLKPFHRLDVNANFNWSKRRIKHQLSLGIYNAYGRSNTFFVTSDIGVENSLEEFGLPIVLPTFRYGVTF